MIKFTFELYPEDNQIIPYFHPYGYIFRGVIMKWLHEIKPELVHKLHEYEKIRPYAINCKYYAKTKKIDFILVSIKDVIGKTILEDLIQYEKVSLKIKGEKYLISQIKFERIIPEEFLEKAKPVKAFNINFVKPISFNTSMGNYPVRFPIPSLLFGNLANLWNDFSEGYCDVDRDNFLDWVNAHLYISGYKIRSASSEIGKPKPFIGGLGNVSYRVTKINRNYYEHLLEKMELKNNYDFCNQDFRDNCKWLDILCTFGTFTNIGAGRTAGMGVIKYYPKQYLT